MVSEHTMHHSLLRMELCSCRPVRVSCWPLSSAGSVYDWRTGSWSNRRRQPSLMSRVFCYIIWMARYKCFILLVVEMEPGCTAGRRKTGRDSMILEAMFCWETFGTGIDIDVTLTLPSYLNISADQGHPIMVTVFPNSSGPFQQNIMCCNTAEIVQEMVWGTCHRIQGVDLDSKFHRSLANQASGGCVGQRRSIHGGSTSQLTGYAANTFSCLFKPTHDPSTWMVDYSHQIQPTLNTAARSTGIRVGQHVECICGPVGCRCSSNESLLDIKKNI